MADAIIYSSLDPGGPGARLGLTDASIGGVQGMYNLLVPCLVTGYGSGEQAKPGQGWTLEYADLPAGFTLKAPDGVYYTFCRGPSQTSAGAPPCQVYMSEGVSDVTTFPPQAENVRSGDYGPGSDVPNRMWVQATSGHSYNSAQVWFLIARGSQVLFTFALGDLNSSAGRSPSGFSVSTAAGHGMFYLGNAVLKGNKPKAGVQNSVVLAGADNGDATYSALGWNPGQHIIESFLGGGCMTLRNLVSGEVQTGRITRFYGNPNIMSGKASFKGDVGLYPPDLMLERVPFWQAGCLGYMPGQFYSTYYSHARLSHTLPVLGKGGSPDECLTPFLVAGEPFYAIPTGYGCIFISLLEKYWDA